MAPRKPWQHANTSSAERGYGASWRKIRAVVLARDNGLCMCPDCLGGIKRITPAHEVDHIIPKSKGGTDALDNLRAVNRECHKKLTLLEQGRSPRQFSEFDSVGRVKW